MVNSARMGPKKVLVTGADGFIGSHLVEALIKEGCSVRAFTFYNSFNSWGWLDTLPKEVMKSVEVFSGDIRDPHGVKKAVQGVDLVFHLAALIGIPFSYHSPDAYLETNIKGTLNLLQACRESGTRVLVTSTSEVYGTAQYVPIDEKHPFQGQSPYSASKIGADRMAESFYCSFDLPVTIVRPFNTYGPRQSARAFIPTVITQILAGKRRVKVGSLEPKRDMNFVTDIVRGFLAISMSNKTIGEEINICTEREVSMKEIAQEIIDLMGVDTSLETDPDRIRPKGSEVMRLLGSNAKIKRLTSWRPQYTLRQGLEETLKWLRANLDRYKADIYNI